MTVIPSELLSSSYREKSFFAGVGRKVCKKQITKNLSVDFQI